MMSEKEFTDMAAELRVAAVRSAVAAGIGVEGAEDVAQDIMLRLWTLRDKSPPPVMPVDWLWWLPATGRSTCCANLTRYR